jgi:hypothetical protein
MSVDRWYLPRIRLASILALVLMVAVSAHADDTWHNIYHHLRKFFTGKSSPTPTVVHHRRRRSEDDEKTNPPVEPSPSPGDNVASPAASATPRVVILPATSPAAEGAPGVENSVRAPESTVKPEPSPEAAAKPSPSTELGPVLRSLSGPTPMSSPGVIQSPAPGGGSTATN